MAEFKGTQGEWRVGKTGGCVVSDNSESLTISGAIGEEAVKYYGGNLICESVSNPNAKLIALAPKMLKALNRINEIIFANVVAVGSEEYFEIRGLCCDLTKEATE